MDSKLLKRLSQIMIRVLLMPVLIILTTGQVNAQGFLKAQGKKIVDDKGENVLLRGMGLGGWMLQEGYMLRIYKESRQYRIRERLQEMMSPEQTKEFYDAWLANNTRKIDIDSLKAWGFNSVRLPMHFNLYTLPIEKEPAEGHDTWLTKGFEMTDSLLSWCKANRMHLILDLHGAPGGQGNDLNISDRDPSKPSLWESRENQRKTVALWKKLAERYSNEPWIAAYDILNEPNWGFQDSVNDRNGLNEQKNEPLRNLLVEITKAIRSEDKNHMIIIEGNGWGNNYNGILPTWDDNMTLSFHKYWNHNDQASIQKILDTREKYNVPVWLGETGENSNVWYTQAITLFEKNNIGWAWWPLKKAGFNNPLEIKSNLNYDRVVNYLNGEGDQPKESDVYSGLMELAIYSKLENNIYHKDVIDAMFRQIFSAEAKPFKPNMIKDLSTLNAVDYDLGRNGVAYYDMDTANLYISGGQRNEWNHGRVYRNDGVDISRDSARYESYFVGSIETGEWLQYTLNVLQNGLYTLQLTVSADTAGGRIQVMMNKKTVGKPAAVPETGGQKNWKMIEIKNISLVQGKQALRLFADAGGYNIRSIRFMRQKQ